MPVLKKHKFRCPFQEVLVVRQTHAPIRSSLTIVQAAGAVAPILLLVSLVMVGCAEAPSKPSPEEKSVHRAAEQPSRPTADPIAQTERPSKQAGGEQAQSAAPPRTASDASTDNVAKEPAAKGAAETSEPVGPVDDNDLGAGH
jgi:hypothetical protein